AHAASSAAVGGCPRSISHWRMMNASIILLAAPPPESRPPFGPSPLNGAMAQIRASVLLRGNQTVELELEARKHVAVRQRAALLVLLLQHHRRRPAPQAQVGVVRLAGTVHPAAHDGDGDAMIAGILGQAAHLRRELDEAVVLDARAARAGNDVQ